MFLESEFPSWVTLQNYLYTGNTVNLTSGYVKCENDTTMEISSGGWLMYNGQKIELALSATLVPIEISGASVGELRDANGTLGIKLLGGSVRIASIAHSISILEMGVGQRITLKGGTIVRNQTDGFIISNFQLTSSGIALPNIAGNCQ
uniref:Hyphal_reg_CWP domain-containing protein n=1 Tax=Ascaris lumbricoides TaxID=6252 RepID=A0A0M3HY57_ASCLU